MKSLLGRIQELRLELAQALAEAQQQMQQQMQKAIAEVKKEEAKCLQEADRRLGLETEQLWISLLDPQS